MTNQPSPFEKLLADFAVLTGAETDQIVRALEFETENHTVRVLPHPLDDSLFMIELEVGELESPSSFEPSIVVLDQVSMSGLTNLWQTLLIDGHRVVLKKDLMVQGTSAHDLEASISEALDQAEEMKHDPEHESVVEPDSHISNPLHFA